MRVYEKYSFGNLRWELEYKLQNILLVNFHKNWLASRWEYTETVKPVEIAVKNSKSNAERADELYKDCLLKLTKKVYTVEQFTAAKDSIQFFRDGVISEDDLMIILNA